MKTLYISDLDGTLLHNEAELSGCTIETLNRLINNGMHFSVATARTAATCVSMMEQVKINVPVILMNGVLIYDIAAKKYVNKELLSTEKTEQILSAMEKAKQSGLMYTLSNDNLSTYYERITNSAMQSFIDERIKKYNKKFIHINDFVCVGTDVIYFCYLDTNYNIHRLYDILKSIDGLRIEKYQDIYSEDDLWYMEVFSDTASKYKAVQYLRRKYEFDMVIGFGDNLNDLPLFAACGECYAVANAKQEVKERATAIIGSNTEDGVAKWLETHHRR